MNVYPPRNKWGQYEHTDTANGLGKLAGCCNGRACIMYMGRCVVAFCCCENGHFRPNTSTLQVTLTSCNKFSYIVLTNASIAWIQRKNYFKKTQIDGSYATNFAGNRIKSTLPDTSKLRKAICKLCVSRHETSTNIKMRVVVVARTHQQIFWKRSKAVTEAWESLGECICCLSSYAIHSIFNCCRPMPNQSK